jgi:hypothetical protein
MTTFIQERRQMVLDVIQTLTNKLNQGEPESFSLVTKPYSDYDGEATLYEFILVIR